MSCTTKRLLYIIDLKNYSQFNGSIMINFPSRIHFRKNSHDIAIIMILPRPSALLILPSMILDTCFRAWHAISPPVPRTFASAISCSMSDRGFRREETDRLEAHFQVREFDGKVAYIAKISRRRSSCIEALGENGKALKIDKVAQKK